MTETAAYHYFDHEPDFSKLSDYKPYVEAGVTPSDAYEEHSFSKELPPKRLEALYFRLCKNKDTGVLFWVGPLNFKAYQGSVWQEVQPQP